MREKTKELCHVALAAAILCLLSPWSFYVANVPITLSLFAILLISWIFKPRVALSSTLIYIALGAVGVPIFAGFAGGFQVLVGPTGGFIWTYPIIALLCSKFGTSAPKKVFCGFFSTIFSYFIGVLWLSFTTKSEFLLSLVIFPPIFIIFDAIKIFAALSLSREIGKRIGK